MKKFLLTLTVVVCLVVGVGVIEASAGTYGKLTYEVSNGEVTITDCDSSVSGSITIPSSINGYPVTSIGDRAFYGRNSLTGVTIPDSVTSIGASAFCHCNSLSRVTIPNSVTTIEKEVFCCSGLTSVTIPNSVTTIGYNAFGNCNNLSSVIIPSSVTTIESLAFYNCSSLSRVTIPNSVTSIGDHAFYNCSSLTSVIIPDSVKSIGTCAFYRCTGLKNLTIGTGVETIDESAFCECTALEAINWNAINAILNLDEYDDNYVFDSCGTAGPGIILTFSDNVESIPKEAFHPKDISPKINTIIIGKNVKTVGRHAFGISLSKESVYINSFDEYLNIDFEDNSSFPTYNAKSIYVNNKLLTNVVFPSGTTTIYASLFGRNETITSVTIPNSVSKIDNKAFCYCSALKEINVIKTNSSYSSDEYGILYNKDKTTLITCPQSSTSTNISISKSVTTITDYAFSGCSSLVSVTIPDSVTSIGSYAFADCSSLTDVYYAGTKSEWAKISIGSYNTALTNATIHFKDNNAVTVIIDSVETTYGIMLTKPSTLFTVNVQGTISTS